MFKEKTISIIIPTLNEEKGIKETILSLPLIKLREEGYDVEVLVVDADSKDMTRDIALALGSRVITEKRMGYGRAYKTGFSEARGKIIATLDADGTYPAELIPTYINQLNISGLDFITVNRFSRLEKDAMSNAHRLGNRILNLALSLLYFVKLNDSQSGMWILKKEFADKIVLRSDDMALSEEIKIIAFKYFRALEVTGKYSARIGEAKLATLGHGWKNLCFLFRYRSLLRNALKVPETEAKITSVQPSVSEDLSQQRI
jgi:glycosyltransferase involved in cell wall biosynthesis